MFQDTPAWRAHQRKRMRTNAHLAIRHDAYRFMPPGSPRYVGKDVVRYFWPEHKSAQPPQAQDSDDLRDLAAEQAELLRLRSELVAIKVELKLGRLRHDRKYSPDQPRVPAGNSDGGQWTSAEGTGTGGRNDPRVISDAMPDGVRPGARYAEANRSGGYPVDLREEEARGGHAIAEHIGKSRQSLMANLRERNLAIIARGDRADGLRMGSFSSLEAANKLVNSTLSQNSDIVDQVARGRLSEKTVTARFDSITGYEAYAPTERSQPYLRDTYGVDVVIRHDPSADRGYRIITAFPRNFGR